MIMAMSLVCIIYLFTRVESKPINKRVTSGPKQQETEINFPLVNSVTQDKYELNIHKYQVYLENNNQRIFHNILKEMLPSEYNVHCQVSLLSLVKPVKIKNCSWAKAVDFVITDEHSRIMALIELDDSRVCIEGSETIIAPEVSNVLKSNFVFLKFEVKKTYDKELIEELISKRVGIKYNV